MVHSATNLSRHFKDKQVQQFTEAVFPKLCKKRDSNCFSFYVKSTKNVLLQSVIYIKLEVPSGKCQRGEFVYLLWNVPIQIFAIFFHNFRGLK